METAVEKQEPFPGVVVEQSVAFSSREERVHSGGIRAMWYRLTHWEAWDWRIKYVLLAPAWLWLCFRARSFWFFTASNPTLTFGGFDGESKMEMYAHLPPGSFPKSIFISANIPIEHIFQKITEQGLHFPLAVKPDVGKMGFMFRKIHSTEELTAYHHKMCFDYIIQEWVTYPLEVSVFYFRIPGSSKGNITGFVRKDFLEVTGDGTSTLWDLIVNYPRAQFRLEEMKMKHESRLNYILPRGETFCLSPALNLSRGGKLVSLEEEKDESLLKVFDDLSFYAGSFYYGRYDIKCNSIEDLKTGTNFSILEYNGSGAEPHHVYGNRNNLVNACRILFQHWSILYRISRINNIAGVPYWTFGKGWRFIKKAAKELHILKKLDAETALN